MRWNEENIKEWLNNNDLNGFKFIKINELKGLYSRLLFECPHCDDVYNVCFKNFKKGQRCGCINGKKNKTYKDVVKVTNNVGLTILDDDGTYSYYKKFKLKCKNNHIFYMSLSDVSRGHNCPHCTKNAKLTYEYVKQYFNSYEYNLLSSNYVNANSILKVECPNSHKYNVRYSDFYSGKRCPHCQMSSGEQEVARILDKYNIKYDIQHKFDDCKNVTQLPFDFIVYIDNTYMLIEYDGEQHYTLRFNDTIDDFIKRKINDGLKNEYCLKNNIPLLRIPYWDFDNIEQILIKELNLDIKLK